MLYDLTVVTKLVFRVLLVLLQDFTNGNIYEANKNGSKPGAKRKNTCTHKTNRLISDQQYEMKPMLGVRSSKLIEKAPSLGSRERVGNGDLKKYKSVSSVDNSTELAGRFINVTQLADLGATVNDESEQIIELTVEEEENAGEGDLREEAPQHKLSVAKSICADCKTQFQSDQTEDLEERMEKMTLNMQRLESRMETLIGLLERSGIPNTSAGQETGSCQFRERTTSV